MSTPEQPLGACRSGFDHSENSVSGVLGKNYTNDRSSHHPNDEDEERIVFMFPGQGSQHVGMYADIYQNSELVRTYVHRASEVAGTDLEAAIFESTESELAETELAQVAVFALSTAVADLLTSLGVRPWAVAGHSLGEYSALVASGSLAWEDALRIVVRRGRAMSAASRKKPGSMVALLGLEREEVGRIVSGVHSSTPSLVAANYNAPTQVVLAGTPEEVEKAARSATKSGASDTLFLSVDGAFHSPLMQVAEEELVPAVENLRLLQPQTLLVSSVTGEIVVDPESYRASLQNQVTQPVLWQRTLERLTELGGKKFIEVGPGRALRSLARSNGLRSKAISIDSFNDCKMLAKELAQA